MRQGRLDGRAYEIRQCPACGFAFVENFRDDYERVYDEAYYRGRGGDPLVDYAYEHDNPDSTIRLYEYKGLCEIFENLCDRGGKWLDFGCGAGGLVRYAGQQSIDIVGSEDGWAAALGREAGIPILSSTEINEFAGSFDFITAIEVFEHIADPISAFRQIRSLLKPGGQLFLTTGNSEPWSGRLLEWSYTNAPDVHISFFEPKTLEICLSATGFEARRIPYAIGFPDIIKYKILKNLGFKRRSWFMDILPWKVISKIADLKYKVSAQPYGVAVG